MPTLNLKNITIKKLEDKNFNTYYLIVNNENHDEAFFCFEKTVKEGWNDFIMEKQPFLTKVMWKNTKEKFIKK